MTCELIQNFSLPGEIWRKFAVDWSQDNKISICTCKAIYIMSSHCSPVESDFPSPLHKQVIAAPDKVMQLQPISMPPNPYTWIQSFADECNMNTILMDHTLNPLPPERSESFCGYRCAKWSPKGVAKGGRCILATLTMDHRLALYEEVKQQWVCICDLTQVLKSESDDVKKASKINTYIEKYGFSKNKKILPRVEPKKTRCKLNKSKPDDEEGIFPSQVYCCDRLMARTFKLAPVEITWTSVFGFPDSGEFCFLIVAMKSGHIQFWKIASSESRIISLVHEWDSGLGLLTTLCWQQTSSTTGFLMCGTLKGVLAFLPVSVHSNQEPVVTVKEMCNVWDEEDYIAVDQIAVLKIALKKYIIVAAKHHALVACEILLTDSSIIIKNVGHSFGLHKLPITGMSVLDSTMPQFRLLIATMEGLFVEIKITAKDDEIKFHHQKVNIDFDLKNRMVQGLSVSANGILCSVVLNTATYFDHLEKREPLKFVMFTTRTFEEIYSKFKSLLKPAFSFITSASNSIVRFTDYFECIRINLACGTPLPDWLYSLIQLNSNLDHALDLELYTTRFLLQAGVSGLSPAITNNKEELERKLGIIETIIMKKYVCKVFGQCQDKMDLLTPAQGQSLLLMADWLLKEFQMPMESLYFALGCEMPDNIACLPAREMCPICKSDVKLEHLKKGWCCKGHSFARCCQSLLLCDVFPYRQCMSCKTLALENVWSHGSHCTYCGMLMV